MGEERETAARCRERANRITRNTAITCPQMRVLVPTWRLLILSVLYCLTLLSTAPADPGATAKELHTALMKATFWIEGPTTDPGARTRATCFLVARPSRADSTAHRWVCVTAAHVLNHMAGDSASLVLRIVDSDGSLAPVPFSVPIRLRGRPLWYCLPDTTIDAAAFYVVLPRLAAIHPLVLGWLATEQELADIELHPGDEVFMLGFPRGVRSPVGTYPILRSGRLASYPLLPARTTKLFYVDTPVYEGNSGGPVYMCQTGRTIRGEYVLDENVSMIVGMATRKFYVRSTNESLDLAVVVPSPIIHDLIRAMPEAP